MAYQKITRELGITIPGRSSFFLFLNHNEFEQNNIVDVSEGTGGVTEAFKSRFLVFNDGTQKWLQHVIFHEFTHVCQFQVLYGGFWRSVRLLKSVLYPLWFMEGMPEYYSANVDQVEYDMDMRDSVTSKMMIPLEMLHGFNHVKPHQVTLSYKTGEAALDYIAREYGKDKIGALLQDLSDKFDINSALLDVLGISLSQLNSKLMESLDEEYADQAENLKEPEFYGKALTFPDHFYPVFNGNPTFFPDGNRFVYTSDKDGFTEIYLYDLALSRAIPLNIQKNFPGMIESIRTGGSALSVSNDGNTVLFAGACRQKDFLYLYDVKRNKLRKIPVSLDGADSPQFSPDGKTIAFRGMRNGISDIYLIRRNGKGLRQLTDTFEDENDVRFFLDGKRILFSREELSATNLPHRQLWTLSLETGRETRITHLRGKATQPAISPDGNAILFVDDESGVPDLYKISSTGDELVRLTQVIGANFYPVFSPDGSRILFVSHRRQEEHIYEAMESHVLDVALGRKGPSPHLPVDDLALAPSIPPSAGPGIRGGRPYGFKASTDFFFPIFFYSSTDGLFTSAYWQASEMLGNHQIQAAVTYASALDFLNYQIFYSYLKLKPQIFLGFLGDTQQNVFVTVREARRQDSQFLGVSYPLNRFDSVQLRFQTTNRRIEFTDDQFVTIKVAGRENVADLTLSRDVSQGRYLETTSGYRVSASMDVSHASLGSDLDYRNFFLTAHKFIPIHKESTVALRLYSGGSFGRDAQFFRTGGSDLLRGFGQYDPNYAATRFAVTNLELRFPILFNINYHVWFFFPDFLFKNIFGVLFTDNGLIWNRENQLSSYSPADINNSLGAGLRFQAFVLQTFPLIIQVDWARRTSDGEQTFYLSLGPNF